MQIGINETFTLNFIIPVPAEELKSASEVLCKELQYVIHRMGFKIEISREDVAVTEFSVHDVTIEDAYIIKNILTRYIKTGNTNQLKEPLF